MHGGVRRSFTPTGAHDDGHGAGDTDHRRTARGEASGQYTDLTGDNLH